MKRPWKVNLVAGILMAGIIFMFTGAQNAWAVRPAEKAEAVSKHDVNTGLYRVKDRFGSPASSLRALSKSQAAQADSVETAVAQANRDFGYHDSQFKQGKVDTDLLGYRHIRLKQTYKGIPVIGSEIIVHMDGNDHVFGRTGKAAAELNLSVIPGISVEEGLAVAEKALGFLVAGKIIKGPDVVIFGGRLVFEFVVKQDGEPSQWHFFVDAHTGEVIQSFNDIKYDTPNQSNGAAVSVGGNRLTGEDGSLVTMMGWQNTGGNSFLYSFAGKWGVFDLKTNTWDQMTTTDWGVSDPAAVSCGYNLDIVQQYVATVLNFNSFNNAGAFAQCNVHEGTNYVNAYWDGVDLHIGDGDGIEANSLAVLDIVGHEFGHAVTEYTSALVYAGESGALNESYSDILGTLIEHAAQPDGRAVYPSSTPGMADWLCGEDSWLSSEALRDLRDPQRYGQPSAYKGTKWYWGSGDNGGVHTNSGVQNFAFYLLAEGGTGTNDGAPYNVTGLGIQAAGAIAMYANMYLLTPSSEYWDSRDAWIFAAGLLGYDPATVEAAWDGAGFDGPRPMDIVTDSLPSATVNQSYSTTLVAAGGEPPYTWSIVSGALPTGMTLDGVTGVIAGTSPDRGAFQFRVRAQDSGALMVEKSLSIMITDAHWIYEYMPGKSENAEDLFIDASGNIYVTGSVDGNFLTMKFDPQQNLLWAQTYGGPYSDVGYGVAVDNAGNVYVAGQYDYYSSLDCMILKYSSSGALLWTRNYNNGSNDICRDVQVDAGGNVYTTGMTVLPGGWNGTPFLVKYNASGSLLWARTQSREGWAYGLDVDAGGNVSITGTGYVNPECFTSKYDTNGNQLWDRSYASASCMGAAFDGSGNVFVTGSLNNDMLVVKYDANGNQLWADTENLGDYETGLHLDTDANGNAYAVGWSRSADTGTIDYATIKYDANGSVIWERTFNRGGDDYGKGIAVDSQAGVYVTGTSSSGSHTDIVTVRYEQNYSLRVVTYSLAFGLTGSAYQDGFTAEGGVAPYAWSVVSGQLPDGLAVDGATGMISGVPLTKGTFDFTIQLDDAGGASVARALSIHVYDVPNFLWVYGYNGGYGNGRGAAVDSAGNVYVTGDSFNYVTNMTEAVTVKLDAYGTEQWVRTYPSANLNGIVLDAAGNVYVAGHSGGNYLVIKYDADGNQLWRRTYDGGGNDYAYGIAIDGTGYVYVTGMSDLATGSYYDAYTVKLDSDGQVVWSARYNTGTREEARAITVDANGYAYVTGTYYWWYNYPYSGPLTIKYDPDGNVVWAEVYEETFYMDSARGIAVDDGGNAYVAGSSYNYSKSMYELMVLKYDTNGNVVWFKTPDRDAYASLNGIRITPDGDFLTIGYVYNTATASYDLILNRMDGDGKTIWTTLYDSGSTDFGYDAAQDAAGNITVVGNSYGANQFLVVKYGWLPLKITTTKMPDGYQGIAYGGRIAAVGGDAPTAWVITAGSLPDGLSFDGATGQLTGAPVATGSYSFTVRVTDAKSAVSEQALTITVYDPLAVETTSVPVGVLGIQYSATLTAVGGKQPLSWSLTAGALPDGLALDSSTGEIAGAPTVAGTFEFTVQAADANGTTDDQVLTISVYDPPVITTETLPDGLIGAGYNQLLSASGGTTPYAWSVISGALPDGLSLDSASGEIAGTPSTVGLFTFAIRVSDINGITAAKTFTLLIYAPVQIKTTTLVHGTVGLPYSEELSVFGGRGAFTWSISSGTLPQGLTLHSATGEIAGVPEAAGNYEFAITATDPLNDSDTRAFSISVCDPLVITTPSLPIGTTGSDYGTTLAVAGGLSPYAWSVNPGTLPPGLVLNSATGEITGVPTAAGSYAVTLAVSDAHGVIATGSYTIAVYDPLGISTLSLAPGTRNSAYSQTFTASGGQPPYSWLVRSALPGGLTLDSMGVISGTPVVSGSFTFTIFVYDAQSRSTSKEFTFEIYEPVAVASGTFYPGVTGMNYSQVLSAMNGLAPYTWQLTAGNLPDGLSLNSATGEIAGIPSAAGTYVFNATVTDALNGSASREMLITVYDPLVITVSSLAGGVPGLSYNEMLTATGGLQPYAWAVVSGSLPAGLILDGPSGRISGTPAAAGTFTFTVEARDSYAFIETKQLVIEVVQPDADGDGYWSDVDCNDNNASIHPGASEVKKDGIDQDCNGYDLTITITRAEYDDEDEELIVYATSNYGPNAALQVEGYGPMTWSTWNSRWQLKKYNVEHAPSMVTVSGPEGSVTGTVDDDD